MKKIILLIIILTMMIATYFLFFNKEQEEQELFATLKYQSENLETIIVPMDTITPGSQNEYDFTVETTKDNIYYEIIIKTYHFLPTNISLYKVDEKESETLIYICDENFKRNSNNEIVCQTNELKYINDASKYKVKISLDSIYNTPEYLEVIDFIDISINSWEG